MLFSYWARPSRRRLYSRRSLVKCGTRTGGKGDETAWVAPTVQANGAPGGNLALGAIQHLEDGSVLLHGQVYDEARNGWSPVLLKRIGLTDTWQSKELTLELPFGKIAKLAHRESGSLEQELPSWPANLRGCLEAWPLKGPGSVILDPHFFVQRAAALALLGPGPVLFPNGAAAMALPSLSHFDFSSQVALRCSAIAWSTHQDPRAGVDIRTPRKSHHKLSISQVACILSCNVLERSVLGGGGVAVTCHLLRRA